MYVDIYIYIYIYIYAMSVVVLRSKFHKIFTHVFELREYAVKNLFLLVLWGFV